MWIVVPGLVAIMVLIALANKWLHDRRALRQMEARHRLTAPELRAMQDRLAADRLPALRLSLTPGPTQATASRIGGPPWSPPGGADWPLDRKGRPVPFLGQLNFAELSHLPDFPVSGLLQIFVKLDGRDLTLRFHDRPEGDDMAALPEQLRRWPGSSRHAFTRQALETGLAVLAEPHQTTATDETPAHADILRARETRLPADAEAAAILKDWEDRMQAIRDSYGQHWIGGHPDWVWPEDVPDCGRVILHLSDQEGAIEVGTRCAINLMIAASDLRARRWDRARFSFEIE